MKVVEDLDTFVRYSGKPKRKIFIMRNEDIGSGG